MDPGFDLPLVTWALWRDKMFTLPWGSTMKFGLRYCNTGHYVDPARAVELVQAAEAAGFESAWTVEHTVIPHGYQ